MKNFQKEEGLFPTFVLMFLVVIFLTSCKKKNVTSIQTDSDTVQKIIGIEGGIIKSTDENITLIVPENALDSEYEFKISVDENVSIVSEEINLQYAEEGNYVSKWYKLEPSGITFKEPLELSIKYSPTSDKNNLSVHYLTDNYTTYGIAEYYSHNPNNNTLSIKVDHFSSFAVAEYFNPMVFNFKWNVSEIKYYIEEDNEGYLWGYTKFSTQEEMIALVEKSIEIWEKHQGRFTIRRTHSDKNANIILRTKESVAFGHAKANLPWNGLMNVRLERDDVITIDFESSSNVFNGYYAYDHNLALQTLVKHEIGHVLGLRHNRNEVSSIDPLYRPIMWVAGYLARSDKVFNEFDRKISGEDIHALQSLYGKKAPNNWFIGTWIHEDADKGNNGSIEIEWEDDNHLNIHFYGNCHINPCDNGQRTFHRSIIENNQIEYDWDYWWSKSHNIIRYINNNKIKRITDVVYTDESGRANQTIINYYERE